MQGMGGGGGSAAPHSGVSADCLGCSSRSPFHTKNTEGTRALLPLAGHTGGQRARVGQCFLVAGGSCPISFLLSLLLLLGISMLRRRVSLLCSVPQHVCACLSVSALSSWHTAQAPPAPQSWSTTVFSQNLSRPVLSRGCLRGRAGRQR